MAAQSYVDGTRVGPFLSLVGVDVEETGVTIFDSVFLMATGGLTSLMLIAFGFFPLFPSLEIVNIIAITKNCG